MKYAERYLLVSAEYCEELFRTSHLFFKANTEVERCAQQRTKNQGINFSFDFINTFLEVVRHSELLLRAFQEFSRLHLAHASKHHQLFSEQESSLRDFAERISLLTSKFDDLDESELLQEQLWADDGYTDLFTQCCLLICKANVWQCDLARAANLNE